MASGATVVLSAKVVAHQSPVVGETRNSKDPILVMELAANEVATAAKIDASKQGKLVESGICDQGRLVM